MSIFNTINSSTPNSVARAIANEVVALKNAWASALISKGQLVEMEDDYSSMYSKTLAITGEVNVTPIQGIPSDWHDLAQVMAQNTLTEFPYSYAILLSKGMASIQLTGSNRYITSDGGFFAGDRMHTFDESKDAIGGDVKASFTGTLCGVSNSITIQANNVGSVGNIKLIGNGSSINSLIETWNTTHPTNQLSLVSGDGTQVPTSGFKGVVGGMITPVELCKNSGGDFGNITLSANGVKSINTLISEWNTANSTKQITLISGSGTQVPTVDITLLTEDIILTGGVIGNIGKTTRWVIFLNKSENSSPVYSYNTVINAQGVTVANKLLAVLFDRIDVSNLIFSNTGVSLVNFTEAFFIHASNRQNTFPTTFMQGSNFHILDLRSVNCKSLYIPASGTASSFANSRITNMYLPDDLDNLYLGSGAFTTNPSFVYIKIPNPKNSFFLQGGSTGHVFYQCTSLVIELGSGWKWSVALAPVSQLLGLTRTSLLQNFQALVDKRKDGVSPTTVTTSTSSRIVTAINGNFTNVFTIGDTITVTGGVVKVIESIQSDDQLTLTTNASTTVSDQSYNINKTFTVGSGNLAKMTSSELLIPTDKGWTLS